MDIGDNVVVKTKDGEKKLEIVIKFDCEQTMRTYFGCTDNTLNENNEKNLYFFYLEKNLYNGELYEVETEEELELINDVLDSVRKNNK